MTETLLCTISRIDKLSDDISSFDLQPAEGSFTNLEPGGHLDVYLEADLIRQYSLYRWADDGSQCSIAVKREDGGRGGSLQMHQLKQGARIRVSQPRNNFSLAADKPHYCLVAGGIGITPIFAMAAELKRRAADFSLYYLVQSAADMAFGRLLGELNPGPGYQVHITDEQGLMNFNGLVSGLPADSVIYTCGPAAMMDALQLAAEKKDIPVYLELFSTEGAPVSTANDQPFDIEIKSTGAVYHVGVDDTILSVLQDNDIPVDFGCSEGLCGSCLVDVVDGEVDHRDRILTEADHAASEIMCVCVSRARSPRLVLDL